MIDLHTHILPEMDDGAKNRDEALALISMLKKQGITRIVLTPHYYPHLEKLPDFLKRRDESYQSIADSGLELILGSETYLSESLFSIESIESLCIGESGYLLLELPYTDKWGQGVFWQIDRLIAKFNICPIIAHADRYKAVKEQKKEVFQKLVDLGCMLQFNIDSVVNKRTRSESLRLIKEGWADFVGSDCHNLTSRAPQFDFFKEIAEKKLGVIPVGKLTSDHDEIRFIK